MTCVVVMYAYARHRHLLLYGIPALLPVAHAKGILTRAPLVVVEVGLVARLDELLSYPRERGQSVGTVDPPLHPVAILDDLIVALL